MFLCTNTDLSLILLYLIPSFIRPCYKDVPVYKHRSIFNLCCIWYHPITEHVIKMFLCTNTDLPLILYLIPFYNKLCYKEVPAYKHRSIFNLCCIWYHPITDHVIKMFLCTNTDLPLILYLIAFYNKLCYKEAPAYKHRSIFNLCCIWYHPITDHVIKMFLCTNTGLSLICVVSDTIL